VPIEIITTCEPAVILDPGEIEVLTLGQTLSNVLILKDDEVARAEARRLKLRLRGSGGVLSQVDRHGLLSNTQIDLQLQEIVARPDVWISVKVCRQILEALSRGLESFLIRYQSAISNANWLYLCLLFYPSDGP